MEKKSFAITPIKQGVGQKLITLRRSVQRGEDFGGNHFFQSIYLGKTSKKN